MKLRRELPEYMHQHHQSDEHQAAGKHSSGATDSSSSNSNSNKHNNTKNNKSNDHNRSYRGFQLLSGISSNDVQGRDENEQGAVTFGSLAPRPCRSAGCPANSAHRRPRLCSTAQPAPIVECVNDVIIHKASLQSSDELIILTFF